MRMPRGGLRKADGHTGSWSSKGRQVGQTDFGIISRCSRPRERGGEGELTQGGGTE